MTTRKKSPGPFAFRRLAPDVLLGTASDRYAGWIGQIYSPGRWEGRLTRRSRHLAGKTFTEEVLPVESVSEYFEHFPLLELDYTFYRPLTEWDGHPSENWHVLSACAAHLGKDDLLLLKAPQAVMARGLLRGGSRVTNPDYLDADLFTRRFLEPAVKLLGEHLAGIIFEQEYQRAGERLKPEEVAGELDRFFAIVPADARYHLELRTAHYLAEPVFEVLARRGIGQVLSHWTWLPSLMEQFELGGRLFRNTGGDQVIRLMTPHGMRYEDAYARAHPFDKLVPGMLSERMLDETVALVREARRQKVRAMVIVNNRSGGNAPLIAARVADLLAAE